MRRAVQWGVLLVAVIIALAATRSSWLPPKPIDVVVAKQSPYWLPFYLAQEEGYFQRQGLNVHVVVAANREELITAVNQEPVVALVQPDALLSAPPQVVMFARIARLDPTFLLGREQSPQHFQWSDLAGQTIVGYPPGSEEQAVLEAVLRKEDVPAQYQVNVMENIPCFLRVSAFVAGTGQYLQAAEPTATLMERQNQAKVVAFPGAVAGDLPAGVFIASRSMVRDHPRELAAFTRAIYRSLLWLGHNSAALATPAAAKYLPGLDQKLLASMLERYQTANVWADSPVISQDAYLRWTKMMVEAGELAHLVPFDQAVDSAPAMEAVGAAPATPKHERLLRGVF